MLNDKLRQQQLALSNHDSTLIAVCKENNGFQAAMKGHGKVYPFSEVVLSESSASFYKNGRNVWFCNRKYAERNFTIIEKPALSDLLDGIPAMSDIERTG